MKSTMIVASPSPYRVFRQSKDYLYGWQWENTVTLERGYGHATKRSAIAAAFYHANTGRK